MKTRARVGVLALVPLLLALTGCLKIDSTLDVNADGSGKWKLIYAMPTHMVKYAQSTATLAAELQKAAGVSNAAAAPLDLPFVFDEAAIRGKFAPLAAQGIKLSKLDVKTHGGWPTVDMTVRFDRLESLAQQAFFADLGIVYRKDADGTGRVVIALPRVATGTKPPDMTDPATSVIVAPFLAGLSVVSRVTVPGLIRNTNAGTSDARRATWEWDFERDARAVERLSEAKMIVVFDAISSAMKPFEKPVRSAAP